MDIFLPARRLAATVSRTSPDSSGTAPPFFTVALLGCQCAPYLEKSLSSVAAQEFPDFDVICLVEESTDGSFEICREWAESRPDARVVSLPKSGSGAAPRNYAIDHALGRYLVFLDGDDWLLPGTLQRLAEKLRETGEPDVLAFASVSVESETADIARAPVSSNFARRDADSVFSGLDAIRRAARERGGGFLGFSWLNAYRTDFLRGNGLYQPVGLLLEDAEWMERVWFFAKRFAYLDESLYVYRRRPHSTTTEASSRIIHHLARNFRSVMAFAETRDVPRDIAAIWASQWLSLLCWFLYHPVSSAKIGDEDRRRALAALFADGGRKSFLRFARLVPLSKRVALPFLLLSALGWQMPGKLFFRRVYYPLVSRRPPASRRERPRPLPQQPQP
jgi:glycosyltransferase involved in cell wall biosynthesis